MLKIAVTGHRILANSEEVRSEIASSLSYFMQLQQGIVVITALADGVDTIFAEEALRLGVGLKFVLPFALDEYKKDFDSAGTARLTRLLATAGNQYEVAYPDKPRSQEQRNEAYLAVGKTIVEEADIVLAVWDGHLAHGTGGTGDIVAYARSIGKELHVIQGLRQEEPGTDPLWQLFKRLDAEALRYKNKVFQPIWIAGIVSGVLAVALFATVLVVLGEVPPEESEKHTLKFALAILEVICLIASFVLLGFFSNKWKRLFLKKRRNAEYLRTLMWFNEARIPVPLLSAEDTHASYVVSEEVLAAEQAISTRVRAVENLANAKRLIWCLADEQKDYHDRVRNRAFDNHEKHIHHWFTIIKIVFFTAVGVKFLIELMEFLHIHVHAINLHALLDICTFLVIFLPPVYAALEGIRYFGEWEA